MESIALFFLMEVYSNVDIFLIVVARMLGFFVIVPILSGDNMPMVSKVGFAVVVSYMIVTSQTLVVSYTDTIPAFVFLIIQEFLVGFALAYVVYLIFTIIHFSGQIMDYQIGFSMVSVYDPVSQIQVPITGNFFYLVITTFLVITGGFRTILHALFYSYNTLPIGDAVFIQNENLLLYMLNLITSYLVIGVQISMPILATILALDVALGLLVKAVPQMNVFVVGMPIKLLIGLFILVSISSIFYEVYEMLYADTLRAIYHTLRSLMPDGL